MPAGSGPQIATATTVVLAADTAEHVLCTVPPSNWANPNQLGNLLAMSVMFTGAAAGTVTFRIRQGTAITGTQVGPSIPITAANAVVNLPGLDVPDVSAFGQAQQGGQYVLTYQQSAHSLGTVNSAVLGLETVSPVT